MISIKQYDEFIPFPKVDVPDPRSPEQQEAARLGTGLELTADEKLCALMEAMQLSVVDIAEQTGWPESWVWEVRRKLDYQEMVRRSVDLLADRALKSATDMEELFNQEVGPAARTLMAIHRNPFEKADSRIKAAKEFLDRAQDAPKSRQVVADNRVVINLPLAELQNMQQALKEHGDAEDMEVFDLIAGQDYDATEQGG